MLPIKRGRSTNGLTEKVLANGKSAASEALHQTQEKTFDEMVAKAKEHAGEGKIEERSVLEVYLLYFKWVRDTFPSSGEKALKLLERATADMKEDKTIKNDARFVKIWIEYADMVRTPGEIFSFMQSNKIGEKVALFWIAWAFVAEKGENFKLTDQIFQKGLKKQAEPKDLLQKRYQQFQRRMARHMINKQEEDSERAAAADDINAVASGSTVPREERKVLGKLSKSRGVKSQRTGAALSQGGRMGGLGGQGKSNGSVTSGRSTSATAAVAAPTSSSSNFQIFSDTAAVPITLSTVSSELVPEAASGSGSGAVGFQIFSDTNDPLPENEQWKDLQTEQQRAKENTGPVKTFQDGPLVPTSRSSSSSSSRRQGAPVPAPVVLAPPSFTLFQDPPAEEGQGGAEDANTDADREVAEGVLASRDRKDVYDPLKHLRETGGGAGAVAGTREREKEEKKSSHSHSHGKEKREVREERTESKEGGESENPGGFKRPKVIAAPAASASVPFSLFSDENENSSSSKVPAPFPIFSDENSSSSKAPAPAAVSVPFPIFSDENENSSSSSRKAPAPVVLAPPSFTLFKDPIAKEETKSGSVSGPTASSSDDAEVERMLAEVGALDDEDGTINTRLAMGTINSMFCSPVKTSPSKFKVPVMATTTSSSSNAITGTRTSVSVNENVRENESVRERESGASEMGGDSSHVSSQPMQAFNADISCIDDDVTYTHHGNIERAGAAETSNLGFTIFED